MTLDALRARIDEVQDRIARACARAGRSPDEVTLIAVSKTFPVEAVHLAVEAGLRHFGENRVQELDAKAAAVPGVDAGGAVTWHLIGSLQRNKARTAVQVADTFHALESERLAAELDQRAAAAGRVLPCYVQVNVSHEASKSGVEPDACHAFLDRVADFEHLRIQGLMTLAAPVERPEEVETVVRPQFALLRTLAATYPGHPRIALTHLSMGMSGDYEAAIAEGATHIRVGSALFGSRG